MLSYNELSDATGVKRGTLKRWKHDGMPSHVVGERVRFDVAEVTEWIASRNADPVKLRRLRSCTFKRDAVVYFARGPRGLIKIGFTSDAERRAAEIGVEVLATVAGDKLLEAAFHRVFADEWEQGEWFAPSTRLVAFIDGIGSTART